MEAAAVLASAEDRVVEEAVAAGITEMTSSSTLGTTGVTLQFDLSRNIDAARRAGVDDVRTHGKMHIFQMPGERAERDGEKIEREGHRFAVEVSAGEDVAARFLGMPHAHLLGRDEDQRVRRKSFRARR